MTSQYVTEPPTSGRIELVTSKGVIDIELFARETPRACRNLLTLALEGFYDHQIFHRLIPGFIIQSGDPSGTGDHGESIYGEPFPIEPHSRLRFNRRGLLAMAATDRANESQFFLTLDATPELQGKHTLMGRVVGNTIYNLVELAQVGEMDAQQPDRPRYPPKLIEVRVVENPFDDLRPRTTKAQRKQQEQMNKTDQAPSKTKKKKKNTALLSFGDEEDAEQPLKGPKSSHDLLADSKLAKPPTSKSKSSSKSQSASASNGTSSSHDLQPRSAPAESVEASALPSHRHVAESGKSSSSRGSILAQERAKYASASRKADSYAALVEFQSRLRSKPSRQPHAAPDKQLVADDDDDEGAGEYGSSGDDDDWRAHRLDAGGKPLQPQADRLEDYQVIDSRSSKRPASPPTPSSSSSSSSSHHRRRRH
ncbi:cyclophilin-like protein [Moesziomyces antarcticus]|uniref:Related to Cyclophilin-16 n=2 Tax=Pseudozyma antarctica TaxID=84753 RepID=A0A5C3FTA6_PSEA2|nr:cyclophilin-like protein [Moesziomyces antarcticus]GAK68449.1 cyclophilin-like protein [Moesziomyces antarcticus]SPO47025.1 related to Cyclophilin-16 [Moesziomyces antarcticus]